MEFRPAMFIGKLSGQTLGMAFQPPRGRRKFSHARHIRGGPKFRIFRPTRLHLRCQRGEIGTLTGLTEQIESHGKRRSFQRHKTTCGADIEYIPKQMGIPVHARESRGNDAGLKLCTGFRGHDGLWRGSILPAGHDAAFKRLNCHFKPPPDCRTCLQSRP